MSKCPQNDMHSLYIDNELPESYALEYEAHVATCEHCKNKQKSYISLKDSLKTLDFTSSSNGNYEKLKTELRFRNTVSKSTNPFYEFTKKYSPLMVAATVLAILLPVFSSVMINNTDNQSQPYNLFAKNNGLVDNLALQVALANQNTEQVRQVLQNRGVSINGNFYTAAFSHPMIDYGKDFNISNKKSSMPVDLLRFVSPSTVIKSVDEFGLERPVFLLQE